ncbi:hypothetical protein BH20ACT14_BH20ACT14_05020 [soil metagenome]|nr:hypothetical protein [Actinomycetota bacterium]
MRKLSIRRPSPAMVIACLALLVALGGTSVAAVSQLARNSVGPAQLQFGAVTSPKIRSNAVNSSKVANRSLLRTDFAPGQLPAGPTGPQGPAGPTGAAGPAGAAGVIGAITVRTASVSVVDGTVDNTFNTGRIQRMCEGNERAISASTSWGDDGSDLKLVTQEVEPLLNAQNQVIGFVAVGGNDTGESSNFTVHVFCYTP